MGPIEIKRALAGKGVRQVDIARDTKKSKQFVGDVIRRHRRNADVEQAIADAIGKPVRRVFDSAAA